MNTETVDAVTIWRFTPRWMASLWCAVLGHDVHHEIWECSSYESWTPEIDERFWCKRCDKDL